MVPLVLLAAAVALATPVAPGWKRIDVAATGAYAFRYVPASLDQTAPAPLVLFFHGAGSAPSPYRPSVARAAEAAGCVAVLPRSAGLGWGTADDAATVAAALHAVREELAIDPQRIAVAGHSAGGAYAYLQAYQTVARYSGGRYAVEVAWRDFQGAEGAGHVVPGAAADSGLFWFFGPENWELLVKVLDGCAVNGHVWVFAAATTSVEHTLVVTDTTTGGTARYTNPAGRPAPAITDTLAFATCP